MHAKSSCPWGKSCKVCGAAGALMTDPGKSEGDFLKEQTAQSMLQDQTNDMNLCPVWVALQFILSSKAGHFLVWHSPTPTEKHSLCKQEQQGRSCSHAPKTIGPFLTRIRPRACGVFCIERKTFRPYNQVVTCFDSYMQIHLAKFIFIYHPCRFKLLNLLHHIISLLFVRTGMHTSLVLNI